MTNGMKFFNSGRKMENGIKIHSYSVFIQSRQRSKTLIKTLLNGAEQSGPDQIGVGAERGTPNPFIYLKIFIQNERNYY